MTPRDRHLSPRSFAAYCAATAPIDHPIPGTPRLILFIDRANGRIGLRAPTDPSDTPAPTGLANVTAQLVRHRGQPMLELAVTDPRLFLDAYPLIRAVADRIQINRQPPTAAVVESLRSLGHLLHAEDTLTGSAETGLIGELGIFDGLGHNAGYTTALQCWRGWEPEEHDFGLDALDLEVKTTTSEERIHRVTGTQLSPTGTRPLWLVSLQITHAGTGGTTLTELITRVRNRFTDTASLNTFEDRLRSAGWRERYAPLCSQRWRLRTPPVAYTVGDGFPRLTPDILTAAGVDTSRVTDVRYRIRLSGLPGDTPPPTLQAMLTTSREML